MYESSARENKGLSMPLTGESCMCSWMKPTRPGSFQRILMRMPTSNSLLQKKLPYRGKTRGDKHLSFTKFIRYGYLFPGAASLFPSVEAHLKVSYIRVAHLL